MTHSRKVLSIKETPDLYVDALLCDQAETLLFLSLWGYDTSIKEFLARLSLPLSQGGMSSFTVGSQSIKDRLVSLGNIDKLEKITGKTSKTTIFGGLSHLFIYDGLCEKLDLANSRALILCYPQEKKHITSQRLWRLIKNLCYFPLMNHWEKPIVSGLKENNFIVELKGIGMNGYYLNLDQEVIINGVSSMIKKRLLSLDEHTICTSSDSAFSLTDVCEH